MARRDSAPPRSSQSPRGQAGKPRLAGGKPPGNMLWLFGQHAVLSALQNPQRRIHRLLLSGDQSAALAESLRHLRRSRTIPMEEVVGKADFEAALPPGAVHQGIAALCEPLPPVTLEQVVEQSARIPSCVIMVLDQVTDPHNVGAIVRSAAAFGALAVVVPDRHSPEETGTLAKSASGALEALPLVRVTNVVRCLEDLKKAGFWIAGLAGEAPQTLAAAKLSGRIAFVMGAEGDGLRRLTREHCDYLVRLPISRTVESLNVSNAAAVALYELRRDSP